jgi:DNA-binding PadR family transcriptional regulator
MRRQAGQLLPLERALLEAGLALELAGERGWHGFAIAREIKEQAGARQLTAHGTLYKALDRLERAGLVASQWEDPDLAAAAGRPRRRLYRLTPAGAAALASSPATLTWQPAVGQA